MVKDEEIKTKVSPFAIREDEIKIFDGKDGYVSINQILHKINIGQINDIHFKIIEIINKFEFITSRQIQQLLEIEKIEIAQDRLNRRLENLVKNKLITKYYFTTGKESGVYRIYCLEKMGKYLLNSRDIECKWQPTDNTKPVYMIKRQLAANQLVLAYMRKAKFYNEMEFRKKIKIKLSKKVFKSTICISLLYEGQNIKFNYEIIRREEDWENNFINKMKSYEEFFDNFVPGDSGYIIKPQIIFVCEDKEHINEVFKILQENKIMQTMKFYYTTDLEQNNTSLKNSLYIFQKVDDKYLLHNVESKILE